MKLTGKGNSKSECQLKNYYILLSLCFVGTHVCMGMTVSFTLKCGL